MDQSVIITWLQNPLVHQNTALNRRGSHRLVESTEISPEMGEGEQGLEACSTVDFCVPL